MAGSAHTADQNRCNYLAFRCFTGFSRKDPEKKSPIGEDKALEEWKELLQKRFPQPASGGKPWVLKVVKVVNDKRTEEGLDLTTKVDILKHLTEWCKRMCEEHSIDPGSEAMQALHQQAHWHDDSMDAHATTHEKLDHVLEALAPPRSAA